MYNPTTGARPPGGVRLVITILEIFPYCPKYSFERRVGMSCHDVSPIFNRTKKNGARHTSSFATLGPSPTTYTTLRCTTRTFANWRRPRESSSLRSRSRCFFCWVRRLWLNKICRHQHGVSGPQTVKEALREKSDGVVAVVHARRRNLGGEWTRGHR